MSLYNMVHGVNPISPILMAALGNPHVPRFRDCYLDEDRIAIYTRTGGGNRDFYKDENDALRETQGFLYDEDDDFDCTYATFYFKIPESFADMISTLRAIGAGREERPADAWVRVISDLRAGADTPEVKRVAEGLVPLFMAIQTELEQSSNEP